MWRDGWLDVQCEQERDCAGERATGPGIVWMRVLRVLFFGGYKIRGARHDAARKRVRPRVGHAVAVATLASSFSILL